MSDIHFGTDGWRAIIGEGFTAQNVVRTTRAAAEAFRAQALAAGRPADALGVLYIGHDCRQDAHQYAVLAANTAAELGFCVKLTADFCPTPTLCWSVAHDPEAQGGIMLTSSHNPAEYLGIKLRMADGGASGKEFTDEVERIIDAQDAQNAEGPEGPEGSVGVNSRLSAVPEAKPSGAAENKAGVRYAEGVTCASSAPATPPTAAGKSLAASATCTSAASEATGASSQGGMSSIEVLAEA
jgi:phosphomannomutase